MKAVKIVAGVVLALVVIVAIVVAYGLNNINSLVKTAVETVGPDVTKTSVSLSKADIRVMQGRGELHGLEIGNPKGFNSDYVFKMGQVALEVDPESLTQPVIVIKEILIDGALLIAEQKGLKTNLQALMDNMNSSSGAQSSTSASDSSADEGGDELLFMVEKFSFTNSKMTLLTEKWGEKNLKLSNIKLSQLGDKKNGLTAEQLTQSLLKPVIESAKTRAASELKSIAKDKLKSKVLDKLSPEDAGKLDKLKSLF